MFKNNKALKRYDQAVIAYPEVSKFKITRDMEFIIMGCDGIWDCVDPQQLCDYISLKLKEKIKISRLIADIFDNIISKTNKSIKPNKNSKHWNR
jgi:serine/threonine protein phosphatase PrpC